MAKSGELGYLYGTYELSIKDPKGGPSINDTRKLVEIWKKQRDGKWKCRKDHVAEVRSVVTHGERLDMQSRINVVAPVTPGSFLPTYLQRPSHTTALTTTLAGLQSRRNLLTPFVKDGFTQQGHRRLLHDRLEPSPSAGFPELEGPSPHRLTIAAVYDLPYFKGGHWFMRNLVGKLGICYRLHLRVS